MRIVHQAFMKNCWHTVGLAALLNMLLLAEYARCAEQTAQQIRAGKPETEAEVALDTVVPEFSLVPKFPEEIIAHLNRVSSVPINAEWIQDGSPTPSFEFRSVSLRKILEEFAKRTNSGLLVQSNAINVVSKAILQDRDHPMNTAIDVFEVDKQPKTEAATKLRIRSELVNRKFYLATGGIRSEPDPDPRISLHLTNATPRQIFNAIVEADGHSYWTIYFIPTNGHGNFGFGRWRSKGSSRLHNSRND